jgi:hypothetical protein
MPRWILTSEFVAAISCVFVEGVLIISPFDPSESTPSTITWQYDDERSQIPKLDATACLQPVTKIHPVPNQA